MNNRDEGEMEAMLMRAREGLAPLAADRARVRAAVEGALTAGGATGARPDGVTARGLASSMAARGATKALLGLVVAGAIGGTGYLLGYRAARRESLRAVAAASPVTESRAPSRELPVVVMPEPVGAYAPTKREASGGERRRQAHVGRPEAATTDAAPAASLGHELQALRAIDRALREGQPHLALALLQKLEREIPDGRLGEERQASLVMARCLAGERVFGVDPAADFREAYPESVYLSRVQQACAASSEGRVLSK